jgi:predicted RNA-binding protein with PUA-like domain
MEIAREAYPDPTQFDPQSDHYDPASTSEKPRWSQVDVRFVAAFARLLSLDEIRGTPSLQTMILLQRSRLSVQPVTAAQWRAVQALLKASV